MFDKALVLLDGSAQADGVLPYVARLVRALNLPLVLAAALESEPAPTLERRRQEMDRHLQEVVTRLAGIGVEATPVVAVGRPVQEIVRLAEQEGCTLILLPRPHDEGRARGALGSLTEKVIHASPVPVLTIPPQAAALDRSDGGPVASVIVPLDGSPLAEMALPYAEALAQPLAAEVVLVRAVSLGDLYMVPLGDGPAFDVVPAEVIDNEAAAYLSRVADTLRVEGVEVRWQLLRTQPAPGIVELAHQTPQSLVALTTHGRSALARWFMGSVAEAVVEAAETPVLVIPQQYSQRYAWKIADLLAQTPLFAELTQDELRRLAEAARLRSYPPGEVIVREGDQSAGCFIILTGQVEVVKGADTVQPTVLARLGRGEVFGEMAMLDEHPRSATVRALEATECVGLRRADFMAELRRTPEIAVHLLPVLVRRLREARGVALA
jgi:nucleotide-binding universal stress UspA family protein